VSPNIWEHPLCHLRKRFSTRWPQLSQGSMDRPIDDKIHYSALDQHWKGFSLTTRLQRGSSGCPSFSNVIKKLIKFSFLNIDYFLNNSHCFVIINSHCFFNMNCLWIVADFSIFERNSKTGTFCSLLSLIFLAEDYFLRRTQTSHWLEPIEARELFHRTGNSRERAQSNII